MAGVLDAPVNAHFEHILEVGVDEMSWDDVDSPRETSFWPSVDEVRAYRRTVREVVLDVIRTHPALDAPIADAEPTWTNAQTRRGFRGLFRETHYRQKRCAASL